MDKGPFIRVKFTFGAKCKVAKLNRTTDTSFSSMENLRKLIFKHFPDIEAMVSERPSRTTSVIAPAQVLTITCLDAAGDYVTLETDDDLDAMELLSQKDNLEFCIDMIPVRSSSTGQRASTHDDKLSEGASWTRNSNRTPVSSYFNINRPCRYFQSSSGCRFGDSCRHSHDVTEGSESYQISAVSPKAPAKSSDTGTIETHQTFSRSSPESERSCASLGNANLHTDGFQQRTGMSAIRRDEDYRNWLSRQTHLNSAKNIEYLSGERGIFMLSKFVKQRNIPHESIDLFVKLLVRDEIRTSLLKQKTNKIFGELIGSPFLQQLHNHILGHLGIMQTLKPQDVRPYLALTEELQGRTMEGWKEVPLSALKSVVSKLEESTAKDELVATLNRLADQSENVQRLLAKTLNDEQHFQGEDFQRMSIVPRKDELVDFQSKQAILPVNRIGIQYSRVSDYLETHFLLLREDCMATLRQGINAYRSSQSNTNEKNATKQSDEPSTLLDLRIYTDVTLAGVRCGNQGVELVLSFRLPAREMTVDSWESSKKLMFGSLLCISSDQFDTVSWGVVARRDVKELVRGLVSISVIVESDATVAGGLQIGQTSTMRYVMVESTASYFEAYYHVLKTLQREEMNNIPFTPYLLHLEPRVSPPSYLLRRKSGDNYDLSCAFPDIGRNIGRRSIRILQSEWPSGWADSLDRAQLSALKQGLTKELAIIQGPPGTGKTFLGLILVKILLANLKCSPGYEVNPAGQGEAEPSDDAETYELTGPILIICYTNHALDQFLEGIYRNGETSLIRIGGRGKSETLRDYNLQSLLAKQREEKKVDGIHCRLFGRGRFEKDQLEEKIHKCIDAMGVKLATATLLDGIATLEQRQNLFGIGQPHNTSYRASTVESWLTEAESPFTQHFSTIDGEDSEDNEDSAEDNEDSAEDNGPAPSVWTIEKTRRGSMKLLPKSDSCQNDQQWVQVRGRGRQGPRQGAGFQGTDAPIEVVQPTQEDAIDQRPDTADDGTPIKNLDASQNSADPANEGTIIEDEILKASDVWQLTLPQRRKLHEYWLGENRKLVGRELKMLTEQYEEACRTLKEVDNEIQLSLLRKAKIVGMTTTAAAKHHDVLKALKPQIVIVEEAAEVLEGHILACINSSVQHLILIGDHLQLRPSVAVYDLAVKHKLDVSMFERLVRSGVEHVTLQEQRRMRPNISKLVRSLYPESRDHESVAQYEKVKGMKSTVFFFDHKAEEDYKASNDTGGKNGVISGSKVNSTEAKLVVELCLYLLNQGCYTAENIAILSMYTGQLQEIKRLLRPRIQSKLSVRGIEGSLLDQGAVETMFFPRVSSVDDYQGEESDIVILSLVRSNTILTKDGTVGKIGFLNIPNRICVALTRARKGLYIFGNADLLAAKSTLWNEVTTTMRDSEELGPHLELCCENHPDIITRISTSSDFKQVEDGGCSLPCEYQMDCGHACPRRCHHVSHDVIICPKACLRQHDECHHACNLRCHGSESECPPCKVIVTKKMLNCKHRQGLECSKDIADEVCRSACAKELPCGHRCGRLCGRPCTELCEEKVKKLLPCGHVAHISCHQDPTTYSCDEPCISLLPDCNHECQGSCGKCKHGTSHMPCQKNCRQTIPCGHRCVAGCSRSCPPCNKKCRKRCFHSQCAKPCRDQCKPCRELCSWQCEHHMCRKSCYEICTRPRCDLPCPKLIPCGHACIGLCGDPCPTKCRVCHPDTVDIITLMTLQDYEESDRFVELQDCGHIFEVSGLDSWMDKNDTSIKLAKCPGCKTTIWRTHRYSNVVKTRQSQVEGVKKRLVGNELTRQGNHLLKEGDHSGALLAFQQALQQHPGFADAHFGIACALFAGGDHAEAITHLSFVVERSSFASSLAKHIRRARANTSVAFERYRCNESTSRAQDSIAVQAIVQWASSAANSEEFTDAIELCDAVLERDPGHRVAKEVREKASKEEVQLVVQGMATDVGGKGHWYTCPNGHFYTIGECGGPTRLSRCPDCNAVVGGQDHQLTAGNRHSQIDGSDRSACPWLY